MTMMWIIVMIAAMILVLAIKFKTGCRSEYLILEIEGETGA